MSDDPRPDEPQRWFFSHLQKTAGTALLHRLGRHFDEAAFYPGPGDGRPPESVLLVEQLLDRWRVRKDEIRVVTGHFPLCTVELLDAPFTTMTVLREPVDRTLSYLRHHRKLTPGDRTTPLEVIYEDPLRFPGLVHNHMVKMLSLTTAEMTAGAMTLVSFTDEHLARARRRLAGVDVVGLQERFEPFCDELVRRFGWRLGEPVRANETQPIDVPASFRARIADDNALDVALYEYAVELVDQRA